MPDWDRLPGVGPDNTTFENRVFLAIYAAVAIAVLTGVAIDLVADEEAADDPESNGDGEDLANVQSEQTGDSEADSTVTNAADAADEEEAEVSDDSTEGDPTNEQEQESSADGDGEEQEIQDGDAADGEGTSDGSGSPSDTDSESGVTDEDDSPRQWVLSATVVDVVDGDTVDVQLENGSADTVRLIGIDTPEVRSSTTPSEFEEVPHTEPGRRCLRSVGQDATTFVESRVGGTGIQLHLDNQSDRRGSFGRLLAYVLKQETNLNYMLVEEGYARVYDSTFEQSARFYAAESDAQEAGIGVWSCRDVESEEDEEDSGQEDSGGAGQLSVARIHEDAVGNDHNHLNDEYIVFANTGSSELDISGWAIVDEAGHAYHVPGGTTLSPGQEVTLYTGSGTVSDSSLYWGSGRAVWNNGGDTIIVRDESGATVLSESYS